MVAMISFSPLVGSDSVGSVLLQTTIVTYGDIRNR